MVFLGLGEFFFPRVDRMETVPAARYSEEFKSQVVREVVEKERTIASVAPHTTLLTRR